MNHKFLLALGLAFTSALSTGSARADEFLSSYRFNVGPDVRWWAGNTSTATNGLQFVTNYGADFKFVKPDAFAISFGAGSGAAGSASGRPSNRSPCTTAAAFSTLAAQAAWRR